MTESLCFQEGMEAPNFSRTLEPLTVKEHEPATFRVFYSGCPRPEVTWMRYTFPIEDSDAFQIHTTDTSSSLTVLDPKTDDSGIFTALLQNACGSTKSSTNLNVVAETEYVVSAASQTSTTTTTTTTRDRDARASAMRSILNFSSATKFEIQKCWR